MVHGLDKFKEYFSDYTGNYVFIGGTACEILLSEIGAPFRGTKDLDIVLIIEALNESFGVTFWKFIEDGGYVFRQRSTGKEQFYRFSKPSKPGFPAMIELFCRKPEKMKFHFDSNLTPIHIGESVASLSAILLNESYYELLLKGKNVVDGYSVFQMEYIILFKIKAWLDLIERVEAGEPIDSKDVRKHRNDIFRLLINVPPSVRIKTRDEIHHDILRFLEKITDDKPDLKNLGIKTVAFENLLDRIRAIYYINEELLDSSHDFGKGIS